MSFDKSKLLVNRTPVARPVKFSDGTEDTLHFLHLPASEFHQWREAQRSEDPAQRKVALQLLIGASLCDPKGKLILSHAECALLTMQGVNDLAPHVFAVCGVEKDAKKESPSAAESGSATSSP
jgi:hypothetical protein